MFSVKIISTPSLTVYKQCVFASTQEFIGQVSIFLCVLGNCPIGNDQHFNRDENNKAVKPPKIGFMFKAFSKLFIEVFF